MRNAQTSDRPVMLKRSIIIIALKTATLVLRSGYIENVSFNGEAGLAMSS